MKRRKLIVFSLLVLALLVCLTVFLPWLSWLRGPELFRKYVLDPIPPSVGRIKVDHPKKIFGYGYTFRFKVSRADLSMIIQAQTLNKVSHFEYTNRCLCWCWNESSEMLMSAYQHEWWVREPAWFAVLGKWKDPEAYAFDQSERRPAITRVLIYNGDIEEAIFVTFKYTHPE